MALQMHFLPDEPIDKNELDLLGFREFVDLLKNSIIYTTPPFVYGVLGDWGTGKTSILGMLKHSFQQDQENEQRALYVVPIWFNAWEYENETNIIYPLLHVIKASHDKFLEKHPTLNSKPFMDIFRSVVATSTLVLSDIGFRGATKFLTGNAYSLDEVANWKEQADKHRQVANALEEWTNQLDDIKTMFKTLLEQYAKDIHSCKGSDVPVSTIRFVVLVDDLDRCMPDTCIKVLESIKNYLTVRECVFVLGLNGQVVYQGIKQKYGNININGREYLEKILNYTFYVPDADATDPEAIVKFVRNRIENLVPQPDMRQKYEWYFTEFGRVMRDTRFSNPRKIKRILNRYLFFINKYDSETERQKRSSEFRQTELKDWFDMRNLIKLMVIAEYYPELFRLYLNFETQPDQYMKLGQANFRIEDFEKYYGIKITEIYPQIERMQQLFAFSPITDQRKPNLSRHAQAVFTITRMI